MEGEERVDVDWADPKTLLGGVVGVGQGPTGPALDRVGWVPGVPRLGLG